MAQFRKRVGFFHELGKLAGAEKFAQGCHQRSDVDQAHGRKRSALISNGHAFFDDAFHAAQANAQFVLDQLADGLHAAIAKVVDIIRQTRAVINFDHAADQADNVVLGDGAVFDRNEVFQVELLVQFVATNFLEIVVA